MVSVTFFQADPTPDEQALADILWDTNAESMGWLDCFKNAQAIIAAGWVPRCGDYDCVHADHSDHAGGR